MVFACWDAIELVGNGVCYVHVGCRGVGVGLLWVLPSLVNWSTILLDEIPTWTLTFCMVKYEGVL